MGPFLENKAFQKSKYSKKKKYFREIRPIFNTKKWLWKSEFWDVHNFSKSDGDIISWKNTYFY